MSCRFSVSMVLLAIASSNAICDASSAAQEPSPPTESQSAPASSTGKEAEPAVVPQGNLHSPIDTSGIKDTLPDWAKTRVIQGKRADLIPVVSYACLTPEDAKKSLDDAAYFAVLNYLYPRVGGYRGAIKITPPATEIRAKYMKVNEPEVASFVQGSNTRYQAAILIELPHQTRDEWVNRYRLATQSAATRQTMFVGGGFLGFVAILAFFAKLNFATNGKRSGILRAASTIAILSLLGGLITASVLSGVFSA